jgi:hypothetical protein
MAETKNLLVYTSYDEMVKGSPSHGQYCQVGEKFYQYLTEDEFDRALYGNDRWIPVYPESVQIILPENDYTTPSQVKGMITDSKNQITELYKAGDVGVLESAKSYVDGRFVDNNEKIDDINVSIKDLGEIAGSIDKKFTDECKRLNDAIASLQDKLSEEERVDLVKELQPELDKIYRQIGDSYSIDGTINEIRRQIEETTNEMWVRINEKYTTEAECIEIYKTLLADLNTDINSLVAGKASTDYVNSIKSDVDNLKTSKVNASDLHKIATTGSYNDLIDKPTIPQEIDEHTVAEWGFIKNAGDYTKPVDGIPVSDLSESIQESLRKADSSLQKLDKEDLQKQIDDLGEAVEKIKPEDTSDFITSNELSDALKTKVDTSVYTPQIAAIQTSQQATDSNLETYKTEVSKTYATKSELTETVEPFATKTQVTSDIEKAKNEAIGATTSTITDGLAAVRQEMSNNYTTKAETEGISGQITDIQEIQSGFQGELDSQKESIGKIDEKVTEVNTKLDESIDSLDKKIDQVKVDILMEPNVYIPSKDIKDEAVISIDVPYYKGKTRKEIVDVSGVLYNEMFDNILFTEVRPQLIEPTAKMIYAENNTYFTEDEINGDVVILREVNTEAPDESMFSFVADQGKVIYADKETSYAGEPVTDQNMGGVANKSNLICIVNGQELENEPGVIGLGEQEYKYRVYFHNGPQITNNYGEPITSLHWDNKRYVDSSNSIKVYGTKSWYASTEKTEDGELIKQPLVKWNEGGLQTVYAKLLPSCIMPQTFRIPGELKNLYIKNCGSYTLIPLSKYKPVEINGDYYTYTYDHETYGHRGAIEIKVEF